MARKKTKTVRYPVTDGAMDALHAGAMAAVYYLANLDPKPRSMAAKALTKLAKGVDRYERQRFPITGDEVRAASARQQRQRK